MVKKGCIILSVFLMLMILCKYVHANGMMSPFTLSDLSNDNIEMIKFIKEDLEIYIYDGYVDVRGKYIYLNPSHFYGTNADIIYPFMVNENIGEPYSIQVLDNSGQEIQFDTDYTVTLDYDDASETSPEILYEKLINFNFYIGQEKREAIFINFKQPCYSNEFTYILSTTLTWGEPLEEARFTVYIGNSLGELDSNYPFAKISENEQFTKYYLEETSFFPKDDMLLKWSGDNQ